MLHGKAETGPTGVEVEVGRCMCVRGCVCVCVCVKTVGFPAAKG
jgi:hypothetical protein